MTSHELSRRTVLRGLWGIGATALCTGCAGFAPTRRNFDIDRVSQSDKDFFAFLQTPGHSIAQIRAMMPRANIGAVCLIDPTVTNEELGKYVTLDASEYPFEIFLRVTVSLINQCVYRYIVRGDMRNVKMGYGFFSHPELYDAIYLHTHPKGKRIIPNSIGDYMHAKTYENVRTLLVGDGINIEFKVVAPPSSIGDSVDVLIADGTELSLKRPSRDTIRTKSHLKRRALDAEGPISRLDRAFREKIEIGHELVTAKSADGMLVTYDRNKTLSAFFDEVYADARLPLPAGNRDLRWQAIGRAEAASENHSIDDRESPRVPADKPS